MIIGGRALAAGPAPLVLGVVNLSPDSPNRDSIATDTRAAVDRAARLAAEGAAIIDVGAQSSYFEAPLLPIDQEAARLVPAVRALKGAGYIVSADTFRAEVAAAALDAGADLINDSDGFQDAAMVRTLARWGGPIVLPFISGPSPHDPRPFNFADPLADILPFLRDAVARARAAGIDELLLDPGTGYRYPGVTPEEKERYQVKVYEALPRIRALGHPLLVALPRKEDRNRTLELVRTIVRHAEFVRAHDPSMLAAAVAAAEMPGGRR